MNGGTGSKHRGRVAALIVALLGVVGVAIWMRWPLVSSNTRNETKPATAAASEKGSSNVGTPGEATDAAETSAFRTPTAAPITPEEFAKAWQARALKTIRNKNARLLGEEVADLLTLPANEAWVALTRLAHDGDEAAAAAAMQLAEDCRRIVDWVADPGRPTSQTPWESFSRDLRSEQIRFMRAIEMVQSNQVAARAAECAGVTGATEFTRFAMDRFMRDDNPKVLRHAAEMIDDDRKSIDALRALRQFDDSDELRLTLGVRLLLSNDPAWQAEGLAILVAFAKAGDVSAIEQLGTCVTAPCGSAFAGDGASAQTWLERSAQQGDRPALQHQIDTFARQHALAQAWAWAEFRVLLAQDGCFEAVDPSSAWLAQALSERNRLERELSMSQRTEGEALLRQLIAQWSAQAHAAQGCG